MFLEPIPRHEKEKLINRAITHFAHSCAWESMFLLLFLLIYIQDVLKYYPRLQIVEKILQMVDYLENYFINKGERQKKEIDNSIIF